MFAKQRQMGVLGLTLILGLLIGAGNSSAAEEKGLVAHWPMDEGKGNVIKDASGNGHNGMIKGAAWADGRFGKCLAFGGLDDWVDCGEVFTESSVKTFTVSLWIKFNAWQNGVTVLFIGDDSAMGYAVFIGGGTSGGRSVDCSFDHGVTHAEAFYSDKGWHHIVAMYDGTYCRLYKDAEEVYNYEYTKPVDFSGFKTSLGFGHRKELGRYLNGYLDEVRIYDRVLSANEIAQLYKTDCK